MFKIFKPKNPYEKGAAKIYGDIMAQSRRAEFYQELDVPDTPEGRFDLLLLHVFIVMHVLLGSKELTPKEAQGFNQALFDVMFQDMDQGLRNSGVGDMAVAKRMQKMMRGFNGRAHVYQEALEGKSGLADALSRNIYGGRPADQSALNKLQAYVHESIVELKAQPVKSLMTGPVRFPEAQGGRDEKELYAGSA